MSEQLVPDIRFDGFYDDWKVAQLSEYLERSGLFNENLMLDRDDVYAVSLTEGIVNQIKFHGRSFASSDLSKYKIALTNAVIYTKSPLKECPYGIFKSNSGHPGIVSPLYGVYHPKANASSLFIQHYFGLNARLNAYLGPLVSKGAKNTMNISDDSALAGEVTFPPLEEQRAIGTLFETLDSLISEKRQKQRLLQQAKVSLLQLMFPAAGASEPEIRFGEFSGAWRERKLTDEVDFFSGLTYSPQDVVSTPGILVLRSSNVHGSSIVFNDCVYVRSNSANVDNVREGDIIVVVRNGSRSLIGKHAIIKRDMPSSVIGAFMTGIRCAQPGFLNALLSTQCFDDEVAISMGATINQITGSMFSKMSFLFPEAAEQRAIGVFFSKLDDLIATEAQYISKLQQVKLALLQKMFA